VGLDELRPYCIDDSNIAAYAVVEFNGDDLRAVEDLCMNLGANCAGDKPRFNKLATELQEKIDSMTSDESKRTSIFKYANCTIRRARNYTMSIEESPNPKSGPSSSKNTNEAKEEKK
jgi:hypothetical protein